MRKWMLASLLCLLQLQSCSDFPEKTEHGFAFAYHRQAGAPRAEIGDELYVQFTIRTEDMLLFESPNGTSGMRTVLQDPALNPIKEPDPIADVLPLMGAGDSVTVRMPVSEDMRAAFGLETADFVYYDVAIRRIGASETEEIETIVTESEPVVDTLALTQQNERLLARLQENNFTTLPLDRLHRFIQNREEARLLESGLFFQVVETGRQSELSEGERLLVRHIGARADGLLVAESFTTAPFGYTLGAGQVIKAWEEAPKLIGYGGKLLLGVPPALGYGATGKPPYIGASDTLFYYFELLESN